MTSFFLKLLWVLGSLVGLIYFGLPLLIRSKLRMAAKPKYIKFDLDDPAVPRDVSNYFNDVADDLEPIGFEIVEALTMPRPTVNVTSFFLLLVHRPNKDYALVSVMYGRSQGTNARGERTQVTRLAAAQTDFFSRFRDGTNVSTNNVEQVGAYRRLPWNIVARFPMVEDTVQLYHLHQRLLETYDITSTKFLRVEEDFQGDAGAYLAHVMREQLEEQVNTGYFTYSKEDDVFVPTLKGAYLMTWRQLWPFKAIALARIRSRAQRLLREFGP
jgi:hypothetical protein